MRIRIAVFVLVGLMMVPCALTTKAQGEEEKPQLYIIKDIVVKPYKTDQYESGQKEFVSLCVKTNYPYPFEIYDIGDYRYYLVYSVTRFAEIDNLYETFEKIPGMIGDTAYERIMNRMTDAVEYEKIFIVRHLPDLSYVPEKPRLQADEKRFFVWNFFYIKRGKEKEFEELKKEGVSLYKNKRIPDGYDYYIGEIGMEIPVFLYTESGKTRNDFKAQHRKVFDLYGEEIDMFRKRATMCIRRQEIVRGFFRPDLSYIPKGKQFF